MKIIKTSDNKGFFVRQNSNDHEMFDICTRREKKISVWATVQSDFFTECGIGNAEVGIYSNSTLENEEYEFMLILNN